MILVTEADEIKAVVDRVNELLVKAREARIEADSHASRAEEWSQRSHAYFVSAYKALDKILETDQVLTEEEEENMVSEASDTEQ